MRKTRLLLLICTVVMATVAFCPSAFAAEKSLVSIESVTAGDVAQYCPVAIEAKVGFVANGIEPAGSVEFSAKLPGSSDYIVLGSVPAASWKSGVATLTYADGVASTGSMSIRAQYVPAASEAETYVGGQLSATAEVHEVSTFAQLKAAVEGAPSGATRMIRLGADLTSVGTVNVPAGASIAINSGRTITRGTADTLFAVSGGTLRLSDITLDAASYASGAALITVAGAGALTLDTGATVKNVNSSAQGGVIHSSASTVTITGNAHITDCKTTADGCIYLDGGEFFLNDAAVTSAMQAANGGALYMNDAQATLSGNAVMKGCQASENGGAVFMSGTSSSLTLAGESSVSGGSARQGAGVYDSGGALTLKNNASISGNTASSAGGGAMIVGAAAKLVMQNSSSINSNTTKDTAAFHGGAGVRMTGGATAEMSGASTVCDNVAGFDGGGFNMQDLATLTMSDSASVSRNKAAAGNGGGVNVDGGAKLDMRGFSTISYNTAKINGGAIDLDGEIEGQDDSPEKTTVTLSENASLRNNSCEKKGGAVMVYHYTTLFLQGDATISDNSAKDGGGIYVVGVAYDKLDQTLVKMEGSAIIANNTASQDGGGVFVDVGTMTMSGGRVSANKADAGLGGGVCHKNSIFRASGDAQIVGNSAKNGGGVAGLGNVRIPNTDYHEYAGNSSVSGNYASEYGGGVYIGWVDKYVYFFYVTLKEHASIAGNYCGRMGSGVAATNGHAWANVVFYLSGSARVEGKPVTRVNNSNGSPAYFRDETIIVGPFTGSVGFEDASPFGSAYLSGAYYSNGASKYKITDRDAYCFYWVNTDATPGHFYADESTNELKYGTSDSYQRRVSEYSSSTDGALADYTYHDWRASVYNCFNNYIYKSDSPAFIWMQVNYPATKEATTYEVRSGKTVTVTGAQIQRSSSFPNSLFRVKSGGTLVLDGVTVDGGGSLADEPLIEVESGGKVILKNGATIQNARSKGDGAALKVESGGVASLESGATIKGCSSNTVGGGVFAAGTLNMSGGLITKNAASNGAGIAAGDSAMINITGGSILENTASENGGGLYSTSTNPITLSGGTISGNKAKNGGGVYLTGRLAMSGGKIDGNQATAAGSGGGDGGGVYLNNNGWLNQSGGVISMNSASGNGGGAFGGSSSSTDFTFESYVVGNSAGGNGGGIYLQGSVKIGGTTRIASNSAAGNGGGLYATANVKMTAGEIDSNSANFGGGIYYSGSDQPTMNIDGGKITNNSSKYSGGGVYLNSGTAYFERQGEQDVLVQSNQAGTSDAAATAYDKSGGGIYSTAGSTLALGACAVSENRAIHDGGGVYAVGSATLSENAVLSSNTADRNGGGLFSRSDSLKLGGTINANSATKGGGVYLDSTATTTPAATAISGNRATDGGGVYLNVASADIGNASIQNNRATGEGSGVRVPDTAMLNVGVTATIAQNILPSGAPSNAYLGTGARVGITQGALSGAIGVTVADGQSFPLAISSGADATQATAAAFSDDTGAHVAKISNKVVVLGNGQAVAQVTIPGKGAFEMESLKEAFDYANANATATNPATITLLKSLVTSETLQVSNDIQLEGYSLNREDGFLGALLQVNAGGTLQLGSLTLSGEGSTTPAPLATAPLVDVKASGSLVVDGATMRDNANSAGDGGAIAGAQGSSVRVASGTISGCSAKNGGAIYAGGTLVLAGGSIVGNSAAAKAGGVYVTSSGSVEIASATVSNNTAAAAAGIFVENGANTKSIALSGVPIVSGNSITGTAASSNVASNIYLGDGQSLMLAAALGNGAQIGVTTEIAPTKPARVTIAEGSSGYQAANDADSFSSDAAAYAVFADTANKLVRLGVPERTISAPIAATVKASSATLDAVVPSASGPGDVVEYAVSTTNVLPATGWQTGLSFTGLTPETHYWFFARVTGSAKYEDAVSTGTEVTTPAVDKITKPTVLGTGTYTGSPQDAKLSGFDAKTMSITGNTQTAAGKYIATVSLLDKVGTKWADGTTDDVVLDWSIDKATPAITTAPAGSTIVLGQALSASTISGAASVAGTFAWQDAATVPSAAGTHSYDVVFTPADSANYLPTTANAALTVNPKAAIAKPVVGASLTYTGAPQDVSLTGFDSATMAVSGNTQTNAGSYKATVSLLDKVTTTWSDGTTDDITLDWSIARATPSITSVPVGGDIIFGQPLSSSAISGSASVPGTFSWQDASVVPSALGSHTYAVVFTPDDSANYANVNGTAEVTVMPADYVILEGADQTWKKGSPDGVIVSASGSIDEFKSLECDGLTIAAKYLAVRSGSTVVEINPDYLNGLTVGEHTITFNFTGGTAQTTLTIAESDAPGSGATPSAGTTAGSGMTATSSVLPNSGDCMPLLPWCCAALAAFAIALAIAARKRARKL